MATNKKAVSIYLSSNLEEYLTKYCTEYDITRKDKSGEIKPALGTAVVEILRIFFSDENVPSPLPDNVPLLPSNVITEDRLSEALSEFKNSSNVINKLPSNVLTQNEIDRRLDNLDERIETEIDKAISKAIADLKSDEEFLGAIALEVQKISTVAKDYQEDINNNVSEQAESEEYDDENMTQIDKASLASIFEDEDEEEVDFNSCTVSHLRRIVTIKGLGKKFRKKLGKYPGNAKKAEIVKFLNETSIFDLD